MKLKMWLLALAIIPLICTANPSSGRLTSNEFQNADNSVPPIVLLGARIYVSPFQGPIGDGVVIIRGGKIAAAGTRAQVPVPEGMGILDCTGMTIMAGFQNSHVHFSESKWNDAGKLPADQLTSQLREMFTRYGFTSVVDLGSYLQNTEVLRKRIDSGEVAGPRILTAGSPLYPPNGVPYYVKSSLPPAVVKQLPQPTRPAFNRFTRERN